MMQALDSVASASLTTAKLPWGASLNFTRKFASLSRRDGTLSTLNKNIKSSPDSRRFTRLLVRSDGETFPREIVKAAGAATELLDEAEGLANKSREYTQWDDITQKLTLSSTLAGLFLMAPQIAKNASALSAGTPSALAILPWAGYCTGFLGNMLLLSYFVAQKEGAAVAVQGIGAASTAVLLSQIYLAGYMPPAAFWAVVGFVITGFGVNLLKFNGRLSASFWSTWQDVITVLGLAVVPQVLWTTLGLGSSLAPGITAAIAGVAFLVAQRQGRVSSDVQKVWKGLGGWSATLLFMIMPVAQLQACFTNPESLAGLSVLSPLLALISNGLMIPRALFTRDVMWFTGASWGATVMGWAILLAMATSGAASMQIFYGVTAAYVAYLWAIFYKDTKAHQLSSVFASLQSLLKGRQ